MVHALWSRTSRLILLACGLAIAAPLNAQTPGVDALIRGRVLDSLGRPIAKADIVLSGTAHRSISSDSGVFVLRGIGEGRYRLVVRRVGYQPISLDANIAGSDTLDADIVLSRNMTTLDSLVVTADGSRLAERSRPRKPPRPSTK